MEDDWMKLYRHPIVCDYAQHQVARLSIAARMDMNLRIVAGDGIPVPDRAGYFVTVFGCRRFNVLWHLVDTRTPVIMSVVERRILNEL